MFVRPTMTAPARRRRATLGAIFGRWGAIRKQRRSGPGDLSGDVE